MSGICALWRRDQHDRSRTARLLTLMTAGLSPVTAKRTNYECYGFAGVGVAARFPEQQIYRGQKVLIACDADLLNEQNLADAVGFRPGSLLNDPDSKTAALLARLYERFGSSFVDKLRGAFSLVLWDQDKQQLLAAIDGFGIKRLVYYRDDNVLLVASRIAALARTGEVSSEINPRAIANVLNFSSSLAPETIFTKVVRLVPGAVLLDSGRGPSIEKYWDVQYTVSDHCDESSLSRELHNVVRQSVGLHSKSDRFTDVGTFLSGGTDSSTVLGILTDAGGGPVKSFSIGFQEQSFNELEYACIAAKKFQSDHYTYLVTPQDCVEALPRIVQYFDEPFGNASAIPTYFCARLAAQQGVEALLAGYGGDELFGGNERYATDQIFEVYNQVPGILRKGVIEPSLRLLPPKGRLFSKAHGYVRRANIRGVERMLSYLFLRTHKPEDVFAADFLHSLGNYTVLDIPASHYAQAVASEHLNRLLYVDVKITLADNDLPKVTCMSELAGIRTRFPFLDRSVAEFSGRIPAKWKVKRFQKRYLFKRAFEELLPAEIIRKKKHGFGIPVALWMKTDRRMRELSHDILLSQRTFERGYFCRGFVEYLFRKCDSDDTSFYGDTLWIFLAMELWHRQVVNQPAEVMA
jgi:asparagine synthase (glutamine-hydrolysing)